MGKKKREIRRVVLDTNVFISALLFEGQASAFVGLWKQGRIIPLVSAQTLKEIIRVLAYPKFDLREEEIKSIIDEDILPYVETVRITREVKGISSDAGDDIFLTCAVNGRAEAIISGDTHLLSLKEFEGIPISKITEFIT
ncbi:MAG: putative toxin-antitoxin system toxin component, PIN family [Chloroflexi bacterium]|nr:putative toxin-antitoxin system toxin component, PIN family [Chloroflexota bacterium]